jgi:hypothetical protein
MQRGDGAGENFAQSLTSDRVAQRRNSPMILAQDRFWRGGIPAPCFTADSPFYRSALSTSGIIRRRSESSL